MLIKRNIFQQTDKNLKNSLMNTEKTFLKNIYAYALSFFVLFFFLLTSSAPFWRDMSIYPNLFILMYYHWILYRPDLITLPHILILSLVRDGLFDHLIGVSAIHFFILYFALFSQRHFLLNHSFPIVYVGFLVFAFIDILISWLLSSYENQAWVPIQSFVFGFIPVSFLYPLTNVFSLAIQRRLNRYYDR